MKGKWQAQASAKEKDKQKNCSKSFAKLVRYSEIGKVLQNKRTEEAICDGIVLHCVF